MFAIECWHHRSVTQWRDLTYHDASSISVVRAQDHSSFSGLIMTMCMGYFNMLLSFFAESLGGAKGVAGHRCNYLTIRVDGRSSGFGDLTELF